MTPGLIDDAQFTTAGLRALQPDAAHLLTVRRFLQAQIAVLRERLQDLLAEQATLGGARLARDQTITHLADRLASLQRLAHEPCLGRVDFTDGSEMYVGRIGLTDGDTQLMVDWRAPAATPFFQATLAQPMDVRRRRRFRWSGGQVSAAWDEWLDLGAVEETGLEDAQTAFLAALATSRGERMPGALSTIQSDQDAVIRADDQGLLVVDGGPGTGKTVVALHRAAYLTFRLKQPVLYVSPYQRLITYVQDVLPTIGGDDVPVAALQDLCADHAERDDFLPALAALKGDGRMAAAIEAAITFFQDLPDPDHNLEIELGRGDVVVPSDLWRVARAMSTQTEHVALRAEVIDVVADLVAAGDDELRDELLADASLRRALTATWPTLSAQILIGDLLGNRALLAQCAPWLTAEERDQLLADRRAHSDWHVDDLPLLDHARNCIGVPDVRARSQSVLARQQREAVLAELVAASQMASEGPLAMLDQLDAEELRDEQRVSVALSARSFRHVIVDEAQDLTGMQWRVLLRHCPSRSITAVGDLAQSDAPVGDGWLDRTRGMGLPAPRVTRLQINYRNPVEVMDVAAAVIRAARPEVEVPRAVRSSGFPTEVEQVPGGSDLVRLAIARATSLRAGDGSAAVVLSAAHEIPASLPAGVSVLRPHMLHGLEMDVVVLVEPADMWPDDAHVASLYIALTRATRRLLVVHCRALPPVARPMLRATVH